MTSDPVPTGAVGSPKSVPALSAAEALLYDRQLRTWGVQAQQRLSSCKILFCSTSSSGSGAGHYLGSGIYAELLKNLVLAGVGHVTLAILSNQKEEGPLLVSDVHLDGSFLLTEKDLGTPLGGALVCALQDLNPFIKIRETAGGARGVAGVMEEESFREADLVVCDFCDAVVVPKLIGIDDLDAEDLEIGTHSAAAMVLSRVCQQSEKSLFALLHAGSVGACFHQSDPRDPCLAELSEAYRRKELAPIHNAKSRMFFDLISGTGDLPGWFRRCAGLPAPLVSVSAVLGGVVAQEAMAVVTKQNASLKNFILFDMGTMFCTAENIRLSPVSEPTAGTSSSSSSTRKRPAPEQIPLSDSEEGPPVKKRADVTSLSDSE